MKEGNKIEGEEKGRETGEKISAAAYRDNMDVVMREDLKDVFEKFGKVKVIGFSPYSWCNFYAFWKFVWGFSTVYYNYNYKLTSLLFPFGVCFPAFGRIFLSLCFVWSPDGGLFRSLLLKSWLLYCHAFWVDWIFLFSCLVHWFQDWWRVRIYPVWRYWSCSESPCCCSSFRKGRLGCKELCCYFRSSDWLVPFQLFFWEELSNFCLDFICSLPMFLIISF